MGEYDSATALAVRLINKKGRTVIIRRKTQVTADPNKPWRTVASGSPTDYQVKAVEIPFPVDRPEGVKRSREDRQFMLAGGDLTIEIGYDDVLVDGGVEHAIQNISKTQPGDTIVIYDLLVRKWPPRSNS